MKLSKILLPIECLCTLSACGSKISHDEFFKATAKVENHTYKSVTVEYTYEDNDRKSQAKFTSTYKDGSFKADSEWLKADGIVRFGMEPFAGADTLESTFEYHEKTTKLTDKNAKIESKVSYYINPFKVNGSFKATYNSNGISGEKTLEIKYEYDKYGYVTLYEYNNSFKRTENRKDYKDTSIEKSYSKTTYKYKD